MTAVDRSPESEPALVLLCTVPDREAGRALAHALLSARLAACVNVLPGVTSVYTWKGAVEEAEELLLVIKTDGARVDAAIELIESEHPYDCPEAIALPVTRGSRGYLDWIAASLAGGE